MEPLLPDYRGASLPNLAAALTAPAPPSWVPRPVVGAEGVVLLLVDGVGWRELERLRDALPALAGMEGGPITTVVPSTTAAALTSLTTGVPPVEHGMVGTRLRVEGRVLKVLRWTVTEGDPPEPRRLQPRPAFGGRGIPAVTRAWFEGSGFTRAHLTGARFVGWHTPATLVERCRALAASGEPFVYAYYEGPDLVAHVYGLDGPFRRAELRWTDRLVDDLLAALPSRSALVVTSDHGHVGVARDAMVSLEPVAPMVEAFAGDARFRSLHARPGETEALLAACRERYADLAWVRSREEVLEAGWLGPGPAAPEVADRVGDVVLAAVAPTAFPAPDDDIEARLATHHGSLTPEEMLVPLLAARGRG